MVLPLYACENTGVLTITVNEIISRLALPLNLKLCLKNDYYFIAKGIRPSFLSNRRLTLIVHTPSDFQGVGMGKNQKSKTDLLNYWHIFML